MELKRNILDIKGIKVGQAENPTAKTGVSVVLAEDGAICGVDVRGAGPGTRETDLLNPINTVEKVHAVVLSGGSAFGLEAASGVMNWLEKRGIGFDVGVTSVPIVPSAVLFDLEYGDAFVRPDKKMGMQACENASDSVLLEGDYGAGCGATVGKLRGMAHCTNCGIGSWSEETPNGIRVAALIAVNAIGDVYENGSIIALQHQTFLLNPPDILHIDKKTLVTSYKLLAHSFFQIGEFIAADFFFLVKMDECLVASAFQVADLIQIKHLFMVAAHDHHAFVFNIFLAFSDYIKKLFQYDRIDRLCEISDQLYRFQKNMLGIFRRIFCHINDLEIRVFLIQFICTFNSLRMFFLSRKFTIFFMTDIHEQHIRQFFFLKYFF